MSIEGSAGPLIANDKVEGTAVYDTNDQKIGTIAREDQRASCLRRAGVRQILGIGDDYYPLPWHSLSYDTGLGGYLTSVTADQLKAAPKYKADDKWNWSDPDRTRAVDDYYRL